jgi:hypothetical protein
VLLGSPLERSLPGELERAFRESGRTDVRVYNWGVLSYVSGQELSLLAHLAPRFRPDLVVVYDGANDVYQPFVYDPRPGFPYNWHLYEAGLRQLRGPHSVDDLAGGLALRSAFVRWAFGGGIVRRLTRLDELRRAAGHGTEPWRAEIAATYVANTERMCGVARGHGIRLAVFLQPMLAHKHPLTARESGLLGGEALTAHVRDTYARIRAALPTSSAGECGWFDLTGALSGRSDEAFWDLIHVYDDVNRILASRIREELAKPGAPAPAGALGLATDERGGASRVVNGSTRLDEPAGVRHSGTPLL